jgi:hypothetical protein
VSYRFSKKIIGGYLKSDLLKKEVKPYYNTTLYSNARTCLSVILENLSISKLYMPTYICNSLIDVIKNKNIDYEVYTIDLGFYPTKTLNLSNTEFFLYVNYFGICSTNVKRLYNLYGKKLIIDNSMAFFENHSEYICFNSARKFFGVPDGAYISGIKVKHNLKTRVNTFDYHIKKRDKNRVFDGYNLYLNNEKRLNTMKHKASFKSIYKLKHINYRYIIKKRLRNYKFIEKHLKYYNQLNIEILSCGIPMFYPFLSNVLMDMDLFHKKKFFLPYFWNDMYYYDYNKSINTIHNILPLPVDQNCEIHDLKRLINYIKETIL